MPDSQTAKMDQESLSQKHSFGTKDLLLHVCCGPCAEWPVRSLREEGYLLTAFYYNPNIHPLIEQRRRRDHAAALMRLREIPFREDDSYLEDMWLAKAWENPAQIFPECRGKYNSRCEMCYAIRMKRTAIEAKRFGCPAFSTTLLVSPYQNHEAIIAAGQKAAAESGVDFIYRDFRSGYREGQNMAKDDGLYRQKYCGCIFSLEESVFRDKIYKSFEGSAGETSTVL